MQLGTCGCPLAHLGKRLVFPAMKFVLQTTKNALCCIILVSLIYLGLRKIFGPIAYVSFAEGNDKAQDIDSLILLTIQSWILSMLAFKKLWVGIVFSCVCWVLPWMPLAAISAYVIWDVQRRRAIETGLILTILPAVQMILVIYGSRLLSQAQNPTQVYKA